MHPIAKLTIQELYHKLKIFAEKHDFIPNVTTLAETLYPEWGSYNIRMKKLFGVSFFEFFEKVAPDLKEYVRYGMYDYSDRDVKKSILFMKEACGGSYPTYEMYEKLARAHNLRTIRKPNRAYATRYKHLRVTDYYGWLRALGFTDVIEVNDINLDLKLKSLGVPFIREVTFNIKGRRIRVDYEILYKGTPIYVEIDGASHYTKKARVHATGKSSLAKIKARDALVNEHLKELGSPLLRIEVYTFLQIDKESFELSCDEVLKNVKRHKTLSRRDEIITHIEKGLTNLEIGKIYGVSACTISNWIGLYNITAARKRLQGRIPLSSIRTRFESYRLKGNRIKDIADSISISEALVRSNIRNTTRKIESPEPHWEQGLYSLYLKCLETGVCFETESKASEFAIFLSF